MGEVQLVNIEERRFDLRKKIKFLEIFVNVGPY